MKREDGNRQPEGGLHGSSLPSCASPFPAGASYSAGAPSPLRRCPSVERDAPFYSQRSLCKCKVGCRTYRQPEESFAGIFITRMEEEKRQACSKGNMLTPGPAPTMRACCLCTAWILSICSHPPRRGGRRA